MFVAPQGAQQRRLLCWRIVEARPTSLGHDDQMHLCYIDDSGDSKHGVTLTALLIEDKDWSAVLDYWLKGRREIYREFGVLKNREIHANHLYKGRKSYCETPKENARFGSDKRAATGRVLLSWLAKAPCTTITFGTTEVSKSKAYARAIAALEDWAVTNDTYLLVFYDGQQGLAAPDEEVTAEKSRELWETAIRDAKPYREVHRGLDITERRIIEDPMMQDSKYSQLIQAVDLIAYGAFHLHKQNHPEIWGTSSAVVREAIVAYMKMKNRWETNTEKGLIWLDR
ncbi:DUF3800 domain-containing protein [uncultured Microbacterium sp.]|uniref:DUF3800 domain-containing protein n=1 Tax=uncultured Microbacterium sp. TaxID=191216 RepID=UPI0028EA5313|nr:DUF3800 domain-containing protein [uncultured Microbacterium sp.]